MKMYFLLNRGAFQPAMVLYQRVSIYVIDSNTKKSEKIGVLEHPNIFRCPSCSTDFKLSLLPGVVVFWAEVWPLKKSHRERVSLVGSFGPLIGLRKCEVETYSDNPMCSKPFCKWFWSGFWVPKHVFGALGNNMFRWSCLFLRFKTSNF